MAKFCGKCGSKLDEHTGVCPFCDKKNNKETYENTQKNHISADMETESKYAGQKIVPSQKKKSILKTSVVVAAVILIAVAVVGILRYLGVIQFAEDSMDVEAYQDKMLEAVMSRQDLWNSSSSENGEIFQAYFTDLNFDERLELVVVRSYSDYDLISYAYRFDGKELSLIDCYDGLLDADCFPPKIAPFYDEVAHKPIVLGEATCHYDTGTKVVRDAEFQLIYQNHKITTKYYRMREILPNSGEYKYYIFDDKGQSCLTDIETWQQADRKQTCKELNGHYRSIIKLSDSEVKEYEIKWSYYNYEVDSLSEGEE